MQHCHYWEVIIFHCALQAVQPSSHPNPPRWYTKNWQSWIPVGKAGFRWSGLWEAFAWLPGPFPGKGKPWEHCWNRFIRPPI